MRIDLHAQLLAWRSRAPRSWGERFGARCAAALLARPRLYRFGSSFARLLWPVLRRRWPGNPAAPWLEARELPELARASFAEEWRARRGGAP